MQQREFDLARFPRFHNSHYNNKVHRLRKSLEALAAVMMFVDVVNHAKYLQTRTWITNAERGVNVGISTTLRFIVGAKTSRVRQQQEDH